MSVRELSDAEVFGAPRSRPGELSDADVFGAKPAAPKREVGAVEAGARGLGSGFAGQGKFLALGAAGPAVLADAIGNLFRSKPSTAMQDAVFRGLVDPASAAVKSYAVDPNTETMGTGATIANVGGNLGAILPSMIASGGATATPAIAALSPVAQSLVKGAIVAQPSFAMPSTINRASDLLEAGVDGSTVAKASASNLAANTLMGALPLSKAGGVLTRAATGAGLNAATGAVQRGSEGAILGDQYKSLAQPMLGGREVGMDAGIGAAMAALMGPRAAVASRVSQPPPKPELTTAPGAADFVPPEAPLAPLDPQAAIKQVMETLYSGDTSAAPDGLSLVPKGTPTPVTAPDPMLAPRVPDLTLEGDAPPAAPRPMTVADQVAKDPELTGAIRQLVEASEAFKMARGAPRQDAGGNQIVSDGQALPDTRGGMLNRKQSAQDDAAMSGQERDLRDASPAGTTSPEGTAATRPETFAFLDASRENGQLNGQQIEVLERMTLQDAKGKPVEAARIRMPDGSEDIVPASRVTELSRPANPRFAQAIESGTYAPKKGVGTGPDQPAPREAAQRITTKPSPEFIPADRPVENSTPDPRRGTTYENDLAALSAREDPNAVRPADAQQPAPRLNDNAGANGRPGSDGAGSRGNDGAADGQRSPPANDAGPRPAPEAAARPDAGGAADNVRAEGVDPKEEKRAANAFLKSLWESVSRNGRGGLKPSIMRELFGARVGDVRRKFPMLANNRGHGSDDLVQWAVSKDWLNDADVARLDANKPGGAFEYVANLIRDAEAGKAPKRQNDAVQQRNFEQEKRDFERAEANRYAEDLGVKNPEAMADADLYREIAERELDRANELARMADNEADSRSVSEQMRDMGFSEEEIKAQWEREGNDNGKQEAQGDGGRAAAESPRDGGEAGVQDAPGARNQDEKRPDAGPADQPDDGGQRPGFELTSESRADAEQRIKREADARRAEELKAKQARDREEADAQRGNFQLEGSNRPADAGGQTDLAGNSPRRDAVRDATYRLNAIPLDAAFDGLKRVLRHMASDDAASGPLRKAIADMFSEAKGMGKREALARSLGALVWSDASVLKSVAEARNSPTISKVWRMFSDMGGTEKIHGETFEQEVHARYRRNRNETADLLAGLTADQIKQVKALLENRGSIRADAGGAHKAAKRIAEMLDAERKWLVESGVELGDTKNYVPRVYLAREIVAKAAQFREAATKAYRLMGMDAADAAKAAEAWYQATKLKGDGVPEVPYLDLTSGAPQKNFTKTREIPIDVIRKSGLDKFLDDDLGSVLDMYYRRTAKRGAFESRFGGTAKDGTGNAKWMEMRKELDKEGNSDLIGFVENRILSMSGQMKSDVSDGVRSTMSLARALTVATFLRRAVVSSLTEPLQIGNRTASAGAGRAVGNVLKMYANGANDLVRALTGLGKSATREDQYRMARMLGTILHESVESGVAALRFDGDTLPNERGTSVSRVGDRLSFAAMKASGLHDWTQANTVDSTIVGMDFIKTMAEDAATGRRLANYELDRLGIAEADHAEFSKYAAKVGNADQLLADLRAGNKQAAQYVAAIDKFTRQVIMQPTAADKPILAKHPVAQMAYGLQSWMYSYWYNVQKANLNQIKEAATGEGYTKGDRATMAAAPVMYTAAVLAMTGGLLTAMRDLVAGRDRDKEREEKNKKAAIMGVPVETLRVLSQAQLFGLADPFVNSMTSARYNKLPGSELGGPAFGRIQKFGLTSAGVLSDKNSENTNTAERQKAEAFYNLVIDPTLAVGAASLPMPLAAAATFASQRDELRQAYVNQSAGPAKKKATDYTK